MEKSGSPRSGSVEENTGDDVGCTDAVRLQQSRNTPSLVGQQLPISPAMLHCALAEHVEFTVGGWVGVVTGAIDGETVTGATDGVAPGDADESVGATTGDAVGTLPESWMLVLGDKLI